MTSDVAVSSAPESELATVGGVAGMVGLGMLAVIWCVITVLLFPKRHKEGLTMRDTVKAIKLIPKCKPKRKQNNNAPLLTPEAEGERERALLLCIKSESLLALLQIPIVFCIAMIAAAANGQHRVPTIILTLYPLLAFRGRLVEAEVRGITVYDLFKCDPFSFVMNVPPAFGGASHAVLLANMFVQETPLSHVRAVAAWQASSITAALTPVFDALGFGGCAAVAMCFPMLWTYSINMITVCMDTSRDEAYICSKLIGLGGAISSEKMSSFGRCWASFAGAMLQGLGETIPLLFFQTGFVMAKGVPLQDDTVNTIGLVVTTMVLIKTVSACVCSVIKLKNEEYFKLLFGIGSLAMVLLVLLMIARLFGLALCPSMEWGIGSGCIPVCSNETTHVTCLPSKL